MVVVKNQEDKVVVAIACIMHPSTSFKKRKKKKKNIARVPLPFHAREMHMPTNANGSC